MRLVPITSDGEARVDIIDLLDVRIGLLDVGGLDVGCDAHWWARPGDGDDLWNPTVSIRSTDRKLTYMGDKRRIKARAICAVVLPSFFAISSSLCTRSTFFTRFFPWNSGSVNLLSPFPRFLSSGFLNVPVKNPSSRGLYAAMGISSSLEVATTPMMAGSIDQRDSSISISAMGAMARARRRELALASERPMELKYPSFWRLSLFLTLNHIVSLSYNG